MQDIILASNSDINGTDNRNPGPTSAKDENKGYSFNGKVVIGIAIVIAVAAGSTIYGLTLSESPRIHLSTSSFSQNNGQFLSGPISDSNHNVKAQSANQQQQSKQQQVTKKLVLVQHDFGWNGTSGGPTIRVSKGDVVQITIINAGQMAHNFGIGKPSPQAMKIMNSITQLPLSERVQKIPYNVMAAMPCPGCQPQFEEGHIKQFMKPDTQMVTTFTANKVGNFKYFCMVRGHIWLGMIGDFEVVDVGNPSSMQVQQRAGAT